MDELWPGGYLDHFFLYYPARNPQPVRNATAMRGDVFGWMVCVKQHQYEGQDLLILMFRLIGVDSIFIQEIIHLNCNC